MLGHFFISSSLSFGIKIISDCKAPFIEEIMFSNLGSTNSNDIFWLKKSPSISLIFLLIISLADIISSHLLMNHWQL